MDGNDGGTAEDPTPDTRRIAAAVLFGLVMVAVGTGVAYLVTTSGGVSVGDTNFETGSGLELTATVYEPPEASTEPAPAVVLIHGHGGERGTMSSFAKEFTKRGYVAVSVDQPGHRDSDPPAYEDGWGGPAALEYTRSLETVDEERVSMVGHSMGGFASLAAAKKHPEGYDSVVLVGSTWGGTGALGGVPAANTTFPRNMAVIFSPFDEYGSLMFGESEPGGIKDSEKLTSAFGTDEVRTGEVYGDIGGGTARRLTSPRTVHTGMHRSTATVADAVGWVTRSTDGTSEDRKDGSQTWYWATFGHITAFLGALVIGVGVAAVAWRRLDATEGVEYGDGDEQWSVWGVLGTTFLPAFGLYPLYAVGAAFIPVTRITHQELTHGYVLWSVGSVAVGAAAVSFRYGLGGTAAVPDRKAVLRGLVAAVAGFTAVYLTVVAVATVPGSGLRAWMVGLAPIPAVRWFSFLVYLLPLTAGTVALSVALDRVVPDRGLFGHVGLAFGVACGGLLVSLAVQYIPLFLGFGLPVPVLGPLAITGIWGTFLLGSAAVLCAATTRLTGRPFVGGVLAGLVVTWMVAGTGPMTVAPF